jgi:hypothetical protein
MPRRCTVCDHAEREAIDKALLGGESNRRIATQYSLSEAAVRRHKADHLPARLTKAKAAEEVSAADDLLVQVRALRSKSLSILLAAERSGDLRTALLGIREARNCIELLAKMSGELEERKSVSIVLSPQWPLVLLAMREALAPYPGAERQFSQALLALEAQHAG